MGFLNGFLGSANPGQYEVFWGNLLKNEILHSFNRDSDWSVCEKLSV